jgi:hypothetical protein
LLLGTLELATLVRFASTLGFRLLRCLGVEVADPAEFGLLATELDLGALQALPFTLFTLGIGHSGSMPSVAAGVAGLLAPDLLANFRGAWYWLRGVHIRHWWQGWLLAVLGVTQTLQAVP